MIRLYSTFLLLFVTTFYSNAQVTLDPDRIAVGAEAFSPERAGQRTIFSWDRNTRSFHSGTLWGPLDAQYAFRHGLNVANWGDFSFAFGQSSIAAGDFSMAFGNFAISRGDFAVAIGKESRGLGAYSFARGYRAMADSIYATAWGKNVQAAGDYSTVWGVNNGISDSLCTVWGINNNGWGAKSTLWGENNRAHGEFGTIWGINNLVYGHNGTVWGEDNIVHDTSNTTWGKGNRLGGDYSSVWGLNNEVQGYANTVWGESNSTILDLTTAWGKDNYAQGLLATTWGKGNVAFCPMSTVAGHGNRSCGIASFVVGTYNTPLPCIQPNGANEAALFVIGNGTGPEESKRRNAMVVTSKGNVGIGLDSPEEALHIQGNIKIANAHIISDENRYDIGVSSTIIPTGGSSREQNLGTDSRRWLNLFLRGRVITSSDIRLKQDIKEVKYGLEHVLKMRPLEYAFKDDPEDRRMGFSAQALSQVMPEVVHQPETKDGYLSVSYTELIPVLTKAIQDQQEMIEKLMEEVRQLKTDK